MEVLSTTSPLVGRDAELDRIEAALDGIGEGGAHWITVEGEPGIGKTRLLDELRARGERRGHLVLSGSAAEFERDVPFSLWVDAVDAYVASQDLEGRSGWDDDLASELAVVLPSMRAAGDGTALPDERHRAHRAVRTLLGVLSDYQALVLVLDDVHWSDAASLELLAALLRRGVEADVLVTLAFRPGQAPERLTAALAQAGVARMTLDPLTREEAAQVLDGLDASAVEAVVQHSGGNPFYLEQLARAMAAGALPEALDDATAGELPGAVAASLSDELGAVAPAARSLLDGAAVAGEPFDPGLAAAIAQLAPDAGLAALDELLDLDLVRPTSVPRRFVFRHPLVRRAVYERTRAGWRLAAHARAAAALEARGASAGERAHHVEQSSAQGDDAAIATLVEAGEEAAPRAPAAAARWFSAALRLLPTSDRARHVDVRVALAGAQRTQGDLEACRTTLLEARELLPPGATARQVELTAACAAVEHWLGRHEDARRRLTWAWEDLPARDTPEAAALQIERAVDGLYAVELELTLESGADALAIARDLGDPLLVATSAAVLALGEVSSGRIREAREHRDIADEWVARSSDTELAARLDVLFHLGWAESYLELYDDAIAHADRGIAVARATGDGRLLVPLMLVKGYPYEMQGRLADAIATTESAVEIARLAGNPHFLFWSLFEVAWARYFAGHLDAAAAAASESERVGGRLTGGAMPSVGGGPGSALAVCKLESGDPAGAHAMMVELFADHPERWVPTESCFNWETLALSALGCGDVEAAERYASRAEEDATRLDLGLSAALAGRTRAAVCLARDDAAGAAEAAAASAARADAAGAPLQAAYARVLLGRAQAVAGQRKPAIATLRAVEQDLDRFGSVRARDEVRRELRGLGVRREHRGHATGGDSGLGALTAREAEIAGLVCDRLTNRQIGAALFLSEKTIESHLRNIFLKLEVTSRVDVARVVERERREHEPATAK